MHKLSDQIHKLTEAIDQSSLENRKLTSGLVITKNVNNRLEERIQNLEKNHVGNNVELSGIPSSICDEDLENTVINICKESGIDVDARDIEGCHRLPLSRNSRGINQRYAEAMLKDKKRIIGTLDIYMSLTKLLYLYPFAHTIDISRVNVRVCKGKGRFTIFFV